MNRLQSSLLRNIGEDEFEKMCKFHYAREGDYEKMLSFFMPEM